jgi:hypothetical protein
VHETAKAVFRMEPVPVSEFSIAFFTNFLGLRHETGAKYLKLGVLVPDALTTGKRPLFKVDPISIEGHRTAIRAYKARQRAAARNLKDLRYVSA